MLEFEKSINRLRSALESAKSNKIELNSNTDKEKALTDYKESKKDYYIKSVNSCFKQLKKNSFELSNLIRYNPTNRKIVDKIIDKVEGLELRNIDEVINTLDQIINLLETLDYPSVKQSISFKKVFVPQEIRSEIDADIKEIEKCYSSECFRSVVILCGRILETALHRKYYEATNVDILEKNPGIGLGKLVAKLAEENVTFDPGLTQQIHLINQVRVFSVHKKQDSFYPSKNQAHAILLYTIDVLEKLFKK